MLLAVLLACLCVTLDLSYGVPVSVRSARKQQALQRNGYSEVRSSISEPVAPEPTHPRDVSRSETRQQDFGDLFTLANAASTQEGASEHRGSTSRQEPAAGSSSATNRRGRKRKLEADRVISSNDAHKRLRKAAVIRAWQANDIDVNLDARTLAQKVHELKVTDVPPNSVGHISAHLIKNLRPGEFHKSYIAHKKSLRNREAAVVTYQNHKEALAEARRVKVQARREKTMQDHVRQLEEAKMIDLNAPIDRIEAAAWRIKLPTANEAACIKAIKWGIGHRRGETDQNLFNYLRRKHIKRVTKGNLKERQKSN